MIILIGIWIGQIQRDPKAEVAAERELKGRSTRERSSISPERQLEMADQYVEWAKEDLKFWKEQLDTAREPSQANEAAYRIEKARANLEEKEKKKWELYRKLKRD